MDVWLTILIWCIMSVGLASVIGAIVAYRTRDQHKPYHGSNCNFPECHTCGSMYCYCDDLH